MARQRKEIQEEMRNRKIGQALVGRKCPRREAIINKMRKEYGNGLLRDLCDTKAKEH